jgi:hypothetical protein
MGADSMTRVREAGATSREKFYANANKVYEIIGLPIVAMTYGVGAVGRRSIESLVREWADGRKPYEKAGYTVEAVADSLCNFVFSRHRQFRMELERAEQERQAEALAGRSVGEGVEPFDPLEWLTGMVVGGYQPQSRYPWLYSWEEPARLGRVAALTCVRPHEGEGGTDGPESGSNCWGDTIALDRIRYGFDGYLAEALKPLVSDEAEFRERLRAQEWQVVFEGMPLQDAADLAKFMLDVGSGFDRFKAGTPEIGGGFDVAVISRSRIHWEYRKPMTKALATPDFTLREDVDSSTGQKVSS